MTSLSILLAGSDEIDRRAVRRAVLAAQEGFDLAEAESFAEACARLDTEEYDCVIADYRLPDGEGLELLPKTRRAPLIVLTSLSDQSLARQALKQGAQDFLVKGEIDADRIARSIRYAIERKKAQELRMQLLHADRLGAIGQLAAGVAHGINNPAAFITTNNGFMREDVEQLIELVSELRAHAEQDPDEARKAAVTEIIKRHNADQLVTELPRMVEENGFGMSRIVRLVKKLQAFARLRPDSRQEEVDVNQVVRTACTFVASEIRPRATLEMELAEDLPPVTLDPEELNQVLTNLLVNAGHAIPGGQAGDNVVRVRTESTGSALTVTVEDTGVGIPASRLEQVFDPFYTTKAQDKGTGLGLSICQEIVRKHGGTIEMHSEMGAGTQVVVQLPVERTERAPHPSAVPQPSASPAPAPDVGPPLRILAVDDEILILSSYKRVLRRHEVTLVTGGREALDAIAMDPDFDGIICDLMMPDLDGIALYEEIQKLAPQLLERLVFCTGGAYTPAMTEFVGGTKIPVLDKPVARVQLIEQLASWRQQRAERLGPLEDLKLQLHRVREGQARSGDEVIG